MTDEELVSSVVTCVMLAVIVIAIIGLGALQWWVDSPTKGRKK